MACIDTSNIFDPEDEQQAYVLVVDDESDIRQMINLCLMQAGFQVCTAENTEEAYRLLETRLFDTIITDVMMPGEDGITFLGNVHARNPDIPVIIMTGYAQMQIAVNAIKNGAFDFIHKPFDFSYLRKVIERAVQFNRLTRRDKRYRETLEKTVELRTSELKTALIQLDAANSAIMKMAKEKSEFLSTVTHEMRTPMNGVIGGLELLEDAGLVGSQREYLLLARQAADNMLELVERMLSFNELSGRGAKYIERLDLPVTIEAVVINYRSRFTAKGLSLDVHLAPQLPRTICCDGEQLARLLDILLCNALKFTDHGGARLDVNIERMVGSRAMIGITLSDSGIGIPADMLEHIFDPFTQVDSSITRKFEGAGLGLSIARNVAHLLQGELTVESTQGEGSSFHFIMTCDVSVNGGKS